MRKGFVNDDLIEAAQFGDLRSLNSLLGDDDIDVNYQDSNGNTALHHAVTYSHIDPVELLIRSNADVNIQSKRGSSVLHIAARTGRSDCAEIIFNQQPIWMLKDNDGDTAMDIARLMHRKAFSSSSSYDLFVNKNKQTWCTKVIVILFKVLPAQIPKDVRRLICKSVYQTMNEDEWDL